MEVIEEMFQAIFDQYPGLNAVVVYGYTPGWNDGETCEHSSEISFDVEDYYDEEFEENDLSETQYDEIYELIDNGLIDHVLDTDYQVVVIRTEDGIEVIDEDYDCGY